VLKEVKTGLHVLALPPPRIEPSLYIPLWGSPIRIQQRCIYPCCKNSKPVGIHSVSAAVQHRSLLLYPPSISECQVFRTQGLHCTPVSRFMSWNATECCNTFGTKQIRSKHNTFGPPSKNRLNGDTEIICTSAHPTTIHIPNTKTRHRLPSSAKPLHLPFLKILTHWGRGHLNCLNARSRGF